MKKKFLAALLAMAMALVVVPFALADGEGTTGITADDVSSLQTAIDNADAGDTITIPEGTYALTQNLVINKPVSLSGEGNVKIQGNIVYDFGSDSFPGQSQIALSNITLEPGTMGNHLGLCFGNGVASYTLNISNCTFTDWEFAMGIFSGATGNTLNLTDTTFENTGCSVSVSRDNAMGTVQNVTFAGFAIQYFNGKYNQEDEVNSYYTDYPTYAADAENGTYNDGISVVGRTDGPSNFVVFNDTGLATALNSAKDGDTIVLAPGTYTVSSSITKAVNLQGAENGETVVIGPLAYQGTDGTETAYDVTVSDITFRPVENATINQVNHGLAFSNYQDSAHPMKNWNITVQDCTFEDWQYAITLMGVTNNMEKNTLTLTGNTFTDVFCAASVDTSVGTLSASSDIAPAGDYFYAAEIWTSPATADNNAYYKTWTSAGIDNPDHIHIHADGVTNRVMEGFAGFDVVVLDADGDIVRYGDLNKDLIEEVNGDDNTILLLDDITVDVWEQVWNIDGLVIDGDEHTLTIKSIQSNGNGNYIVYKAEDLKVQDLNVVIESGNGFDLTSGSLENVNLTHTGENNGAVGVVVNSTSPEDTVLIDNCTIENFDGYGIYSEPADKTDLTITNSKITGCDRVAVITYSPNVTFTGNTVTGGEEVSFAGGANNETMDYTITGNIFEDAGKIWFYGADLSEVTFEKNQVLGETTVNTEGADGDTVLDLSENYWGGSAPKDSQVDGDNVKGTDVYYEAATMRPQDLNTYVPPVVIPSYAVNVTDTPNGTVRVNPASAREGATVTITATPNDGYELASIVVTGGDGDRITLQANPNGTYAFAMPGSQVTVTAIFVAEEPIVFTDVPTGEWYYDAVYWAVENGITDGTSDTLFSPGREVTRAEMVTFLWRAAGCPEPETTVNPFADVDEDEYYYDAVLWAVENGITDGVSATEFDPDGECTRAQMVTFLWRAAGEPDAGTSNPFTDVDEEEYYYEAILWAAASGVTDGVSETTFEPGTVCTRAQAVTFLYRDRT